MASSVTAASVVNAANSAASPTAGAFKQLSFYLAKNEVALYPKWNVYDTLFGSIKGVTTDVAMDNDNLTSALTDDQTITLT